MFTPFQFLNSINNSQTAKKIKFPNCHFGNLAKYLIKIVNFCWENFPLFSISSWLQRNKVNSPDSNPSLISISLGEKLIISNNFGSRKEKMK